MAEKDEPLVLRLRPLTKDEVLQSLRRAGVLARREYSPEDIARFKDITDALTKATQQGEVVVTADGYPRDPASRFPAPPKIGLSCSFCLTFLIGDKQYEILLGDLEETFCRHSENFGPTRARLLFWVGLMDSVFPLLVEQIRRRPWIAAFLGWLLGRAA